MQKVEDRFFKKMPAVIKTFLAVLLAFAGGPAFSHEIFEFEGHTYKIIDSAAT